MAAAAYALGCQPPVPDGHSSSRDFCEKAMVDSDLCTENEARYFEAGYEGWCEDLIGSIISKRGLERSAFYQAGKVLSEFRTSRDTFEDIL